MLNRQPKFKEELKERVNITNVNKTQGQEEAINLKISSLQYSINRFDHYYDTINNKGNLFLALNTFLIGGSVTGYFSLNDLMGLGLFLLFGIIGLFFSFISISFTLMAIYPYLGKRNSVDEMKSTINFSEISNKTKTEFRQLYEEYNENSYYNDLVEQVWQLSIGLRNKFIKLQYATLYLGGAFLLLVITIIKILIQ